MTCGHTLFVTGSSADPLFTYGEYGRLNAFRHQHFLLFLIAHFHKAALLMFSDRLAEAVSSLDVDDRVAIRDSRDTTWRELETFMRFAHRYWFRVVSNQSEAHELFALCRGHFDLDRLYEEIRLEIQEMSQYLENDASRRQNETMKRPTVVTTFGLIGTTVTGFLGMNLLAWADQNTQFRLGAFAIVAAVTGLLTVLTIVKSRRLSDSMDALSDETKYFGDKIKSCLSAFRRSKY